MKRIQTTLLAALLSLGSMVHAAETGVVAEIFACNYINNGTMADIDSATEFFKETITSLNNPALNALNAYVWTPFRAQTDVDVLWFSVHANLNAFGAVTDAMAGPEGQAVQARYFEKVDCASSIHEMTNIYSTESVELLGPTVIEAYRCNLHDGQTMAGVQATLEEWRAYMDGQSLTNYIAFMMTPIASSAGFDLSYFAVHESASAYAAHQTSNLATPEGQAIGAKFGALHRCDSSVWTGRGVIQGAQ